MKRLMVMCICGERIQVPRSAIGKSGLCPACGRAIVITADSAVPLRTQPQARPAPVPPSATPYYESSPVEEPNDEAKRRFAEGVDLYFAKRYAEALALFSSLLAAHPRDPDVMTARAVCFEALRRPVAFALEHKPAPAALEFRREVVVEPEPAVVSAPPAPSRKPLPEKLSEDTLKQVLLDKMMNGATEEIQMRATELAIEIFGFGVKKTEPVFDEFSEIERMLEGDAQRSSPPPMPRRSFVARRFVSRESVEM